MRTLGLGLSYACLVAAISGSAALSSSGAPAADLTALPRPSLESLDAASRELVSSRRASLDELVSQGVAASRTMAAVFGEMGRIYLLHELASAADACFANATRLRPDDYRWHYYRAVIETANGGLEAAVAHLETVASLVPEDLPTRLRLGRLDLALGRPADARRQFSTALELAPGEEAARQGLAAVEAALLGEAVELRTPQFDDPLLDGLQSLEVRLRIDAAVEALQRGEAVLAGERLEAVLAEHPEAWRAHYQLGVARFHAGEAAQAIASVRRALELAPDFAEGHFRLASALAATGREEEALVHYDRAVALAPDQADARAALAGALARAGRFVEAAGHFAEVARVQPDTPAPRFSQALALLLAGRDVEARDVLEVAVASLPGEPSCLHLLARVLAASNEDAIRDGARALVVARQVLAAESTIEHAETVAMALAEVGDFAQAVAWQERIVANLGGPSAPRAAAAAARLVGYRRGEPSRAPWAVGGEAQRGLLATGGESGR